MTKKYLFILVLIGIISCEKDDFCTENPVTPNLVIRFMDKANIKNLKKVSNLSVWAENRKDSIYKNTGIDSTLAIPLNTITTKTVYNFAKGNDSISKITIEYIPKEDYVSRSCGYRIIFNNVKILKNTLPTSWIDSIPSKTIKTINNQTNAHITFYH